MYMDAQERELERLRDAMEQAKTLYERAKAEHDCALRLMKELGATHPDGSIRHATSVYNFTFANYRQALHEFATSWIARRRPSLFAATQIWRTT